MQIRQEPKDCSRSQKANSTVSRNNRNTLWELPELMTEEQSIEVMSNSKMRIRPYYEV
jgi:hypothetical protein